RAPRSRQPSGRSAIAGAAGDRGAGQRGGKDFRLATVRRARGSGAVPLALLVHTTGDRLAGGGRNLRLALRALPHARRRAARGTGGPRRSVRAARDVAPLGRAGGQHGAVPARPAPAQSETTPAMTSAATTTEGTLVALHGFAGSPESFDEL